jgi:adenosylcobinamide-phosphate synthase
MFLFDLTFLAESLLMFGLAFFIDIIFGEIPDRAHPTVWMGRIVAYLKPKMRNPNPKVEKFYGVLLCTGLIALFSVPVFFGLWALRQIPVWGWLIYIVVGAILLKTTFALNCMRHYTYPIEKALKKGDVSQAKTVAVLLSCAVTPTNLISAT